MKMKISKREKILLIILAFIVTLGGYYKYVFLQQRDKLNKLLEEKDQCTKKVENIKKQSVLIKQKEFDIKVLNSKIGDKTALLFPKLEEEKLIVELDSIIDKSNLKANSLNFTEVYIKPVDEKKEKQEKKEVKNPLKDLADEYNGVKIPKDNKKSANTNDKKEESSNAENMAISINFKGNYGDVISFMKALEVYSKKIVLTDLKLSQDAAGGVLGSTTLQFYAIPKLGDEDRDFLKWNFNNIYGKDNPFDGSTVSSLVGSTIEEIGKVNKEQKYDFVMSVRAISSDLPSIMLGRSEDITKRTYIYADNPGVENIEIYLTKKNNKYYYKYKTSRDKYPYQFNEDGEEFVPTNNISFKIYSTKRFDGSDFSGANIKIYNKTDKTANVIVDTDDTTKPRVTITGEGGNVDVKRN